MNSFHPLHFEDFKKSGLSDETIRKAGIKSISPNRITKLLGFDIDGLISAYEIPYPNCNDYFRVKAFYEQGKEHYSNGKRKPKYLQRKDTVNHLYIPQRVKSMLSDPTVPLVITEGEKKALKACQEGLCCIAISGLWNWSNGSKELIPDFDLITLEGREVYIVPDNDWLQPNKHGYKKNLIEAIYELIVKLEERGAKVKIIELPSGELKGLDDYLCQHTVDEFKHLPIKKLIKRSLPEMIKNATPDDIPDILRKLAKVKSETERGLYIQGLSEKLKVSKRAIQKDLKPLIRDKHTEDIEIIYKANFQGLIELVIDEDGGVSYLIKSNGELQVETVWEIAGVIYSPPDKKNLPFVLPKANEVIKWYQSDNDQRLFEDVIVYLKRFSYLPNKQWFIITCGVFLSYLQDHQDINYMPMILLYAVPERGKTRTGRAVTLIAYRGVHCVDLREANLFRFSQDLQATLFFDIMNLWKKAERNGAEDILLLRHEKGAKATRVIYPEKGAFKDTVYYDVYGATFLGTNEPLHKILDSRCISITPPNKPEDYESPTPEKAQEIKERLTAWRARVMETPLPEIELIQGLNGRLWDISKPLLQVCKLVSPKGYDELRDALIEIAGQRLEDKKDSIEGQIVSALYELSSEVEIIPEWIIKTQDLLELLNKNRPETYKLTSQYLGRKLKAMDFSTKTIMGYSQIRLKRSDFNLLLVQYGIIENNNVPVPVETLLNPTKPSNQGISTVYGSRELVESQRNPTKTLLSQSLDNQASESLVESSRELRGTGEEIIIEGEK